MGIARNNTYMRAHFNNSRIDKQTKKFDHLRTSDFIYYDKKTKQNKVRKVKTEQQPQKTEDYKNLIDFFKDISNREYTCAGLNSFERELLIIDCDDTDFGESTRNLLQKYGIQWDYQKIKSSNGHSQTGIFLSEKVYLYDYHWDYDYDCYVENHRENEHEMYKRVYNYLNFIANGDLMYTGYNCQNPMFEADYTHTEWQDNAEHHTLAWWDKKLSAIVSSDEFLKAHKEAYATKKKPVRKKIAEALEEIEKTVIKSDNETDEEFAKRKNEATAKALVLAEKSGNKSINYAILQEVQRTLKYCLDHHKPFTLRRAQDHVAYLYDESNRKCAYYHKIGNDDKARLIDMFAGYTRDETKHRAMTDYWQLVEGRLTQTDLSKIGYNVIQRDLSQTVAQVKRYIKYFRLQKIKKDNDDLSERDIAKLYKETYNEPMSKTTVRNCASMTIPEDLLLPNKWQPLLCYNAPLTRRYYTLENDLIDARNNLLGGHLQHVTQHFVPLFQDGYWILSDKDDDNLPNIPYSETFSAKSDLSFAALHANALSNQEIAVGVVLSNDFSPKQSQSITFQYFSNDNIFILSSSQNMLAFSHYNNGWTTIQTSFHILE